MSTYKKIIQIFIIIAAICNLSLNAMQAKKEQSEQAFIKAFAAVEEMQSYSPALKENIKKLIEIYRESIRCSNDIDVVQRAIDTLQELVALQSKLFTKSTHLARFTIRTTARLIALNIEQAQKKSSRLHACRAWMHEYATKMVKAYSPKIISMLEKTTWTKEIHKELVNEFNKNGNRLIVGYVLNQAVEKKLEKAQKETPQEAKPMQTDDYSPDCLTSKEKIEQAQESLLQAVSTSSLYDLELKKALQDLIKQYGEELNKSSKCFAEWDFGINMLNQLAIWQTILSHIISSTKNSNLLQKIKETSEQFAQTIESFNKPEMYDCSKHDGFFKASFKKLLRPFVTCTEMTTVTPKEVFYALRDEDTRNTSSLELLRLGCEATPVITGLVQKTLPNKITSPEDVDSDCESQSNDEESDSQENEMEMNDVEIGLLLRW